jgi:hypothetical protein
MGPFGTSYSYEDAGYKPGTGNNFFKNLGGTISRGLGGLGDWLTKKPGQGSIDQLTAGKPEFDQHRDSAAGMQGQFLGFQTPESSFRQGQEGLYDMFMRRARGEDSLSALQLKDAADKQRSFSLATAAGGSPLQQRMALQNASQAEAGLAGRVAQAGIMERGQAGELAAGIANQGRQQDLQAALEAQGLRVQGGLGAGKLGLDATSNYYDILSRLLGAQMGQKSNMDHLLGGLGAVATSRFGK